MPKEPSASKNSSAGPEPGLETLLSYLTPQERAELDRLLTSGPKTTEDDYTEYERLGREGYFARETDFPTALKEYRAALDGARALGITARPVYEYEFVMYPPKTPKERVSRDVRKAWSWLTEMWLRVDDGLPPVTRAEAEGLNAWLDANHKRLDPGPDYRVFFDVGSVRYHLSHLRVDLRDMHSGEKAEIVRRLRRETVLPALSVETHP
jgi:hypothetical protein